MLKMEDGKISLYRMRLLTLASWHLNLSRALYHCIARYGGREEA